MEIKLATVSARVTVTIVHIIGHVDSSTYQQFQKSCDEAIRNGAQYVLLDLGEAPFVSSAGFRVIHEVFNKLRAIHKDVDDDALRKKMQAGTYRSPYLKVVNLSSQVHDAFVISGFDTYIEVYTDLKKAVASY